ncbi:helix-turn-helix domain-containing protein [Gardnerella vaginalis]|uniref:helix-turn-helix domain-containing protein n=1 Tax=Gardnerella vaginalis TaxID=2702 RepID=UPI000C7B51DE|nr:helix-turn-helix domain-containing protein [Gardnerella vaginalis]NSX29529.1 helix-turn-helix domain-containing protein [Gardnerella vaginalis]PKZ47027.1 excisionase [Gardnerella vaginalis]
MSIFVNDTLLTREEAATKLAVSTQRVSALCSNHLLTTYTFGSRKILISLDSVNRYKQQNSKSGRSYAPTLAFAALFMLSGCEVSWINRQQKYRIEAYLRSITPQDLVNRSKNRAKTMEYWCRKSRLVELSDHLILSAATGNMHSQFQLTQTDKIEGYVSSNSLGDLINKFHLKNSENGADSSIINVKLHVIENSEVFDFIIQNVSSHITEDTQESSTKSFMPIAVCASDLAESLDVRERQAGLNKLAELIAKYNH